MFAVIMQSSREVWGDQHIRQTAVIPMLPDPKSGLARAPRVFYRSNATRGISGAWTESTPVFAHDETAFGQPRAIKLTENNRQMLEFPITPQTVMQRLLRELEIAPNASSTLASEVFDGLVESATNNPVLLVQYTEDVVTPVTPQVTAPTPVVAEPVVDTELVFDTDTGIISSVTNEPEPLILSAETVAIPITITHPTPTESEPLMEPTMAFQAVTQVTESASVLTIPDVQTYFPRVHSGKTEEEILSYAQATQQAVLFTGAAGTGKTSSARHYAATHQLPFVTIECTQQIDQTVTQGRFVPTADGQVRWLDSQLATAIQQPSVILFNELTRMSPKAASLFLRLLEERELAIEPLNKVIKVHPECLIIADQNTGYGYTGTSKQDAALVDRFNIKVEFEYDIEIEKNFIKSPALLAFADGIRVAAKMNDEFSVPMSTRVLINFQAQAQNLGFEFAVNSLLNNFPKTDGEREGIKMRLDADALTIASELGVEYESYDAN